MNKKPRRCDNCRFSVPYTPGDALGCLSRGCITDPENSCEAHKFKPGKHKSK